MKRSQHQGATGDRQITLKQLAREYGDLKLGVHEKTAGRLATWLSHNEELVEQLNLEEVDGVRIRVLNDSRNALSDDEIDQISNGFVAVAKSGFDLRKKLLLKAVQSGFASTGKAIKELHGAARTNAIWAWLGRGAKTVGGSGIIGGKILIGAVLLVPVVIAGGAVVVYIAVRSNITARDFAANVESEVRRISRATDTDGVVDRRVRELWVQLVSTGAQATEALDALEALVFDPRLHARDFLHAVNAVAAVEELLQTPVLG